jgi:hypothetical protein
MDNCISGITSRSIQTFFAGCQFSPLGRGTRP